MKDTTARLFKEAGKALASAIDVVRCHKLEDGEVTADVVKDNMDDSGWMVRVRGQYSYLVELDDSLKAFTLFQVSHRGSFTEEVGTEPRPSRKPGA
jgi:hypothetical protein